ncbi:phage shock protein PspA [Novosphingobium album (ex Liu et al. 2023)]|uniref:Phage shock protein PspA n=1 Tax=Novosphingobium album (ex Liu et al. 2023) TaxID=3031130 RepID=A0ABT5WSQ8_9SPHN|nr:phage shock protein PspA [Novosphingobium album (ex Liu et al. 2023)]MDE8653074.1 phage shock protein PspA [Novosphingobium album (ex Liu et al. 2023)]
MSRLDAEIEILQHDPAPAFAGEGPARTTSRARSNYAGPAHVSPRLIAPAYIKGTSRMGIFSRTRDIIAANFNDMLDKAEDPAKMIRLIILEMEETLVEVRTSSARTIADQKEMRRHVAKLDKLQADWGEKAQLALSKDREDLARAALVEKKKAADMAGQLSAEIAVLDDALRAYEQDIEKLQSRLREARARQSSIAARLQSAENRVKLRTLLSSERVDEAMVRFDQLERRVDYAEGRADALSLGDDRRQPTLSEEIAALADGDKIEAELARMKQAMSGQQPAAKAGDGEGAAD